MTPSIKHVITINNQLLINNIITRGWNVAPLMVLVAGARGTTHIPSMRKLEKYLNSLSRKLKYIQTN
jgi:hypothetical protein